MAAYNLRRMSAPLELHQHRSLRPLNTFGVEANTAHYLEVTDLGQLQALRADPKFSTMPRLILGGGSNLLLTQDFPGVVLHIKNRGIEVCAEHDQAVMVKASAGESWHALVQWTLAQGLPGLENLSLIPGSVGAAPIQNIGAYGSELADFFHSLTAFDMTSGELLTLSKADCAFGYRDSIFKHSLRELAVIWEITLTLPRQWQANLRYTELAAEMTARGKTQPTAQDIAAAVVAIRTRKLPDPSIIGNAGSFFKNPVVSAERRNALLAKYPALVSYAQPDGSYKLAAGWLIDQCGWKGRSVGAAGVHEKQALVLVNRGGASGAEILQLAEQIRSEVLEKYGVMLEPEPVIV